MHTCSFFLCFSSNFKNYAWLNRCFKLIEHDLLFFTKDRLSGMDNFSKVFETWLIEMILNIYMKRNRTWFENGLIVVICIVIISVFYEKKVFSYLQEPLSCPFFMHLLFIDWVDYVKFKWWKRKRTLFSNYCIWEYCVISWFRKICKETRNINNT